YSADTHRIDSDYRATAWTMEMVYANRMTMQTIKSSTQDQNPPTSPGDQHSDSGVVKDTMAKRSTLSETVNQLQTNYSSLKAERDELLTNYSSLKAERDELLTNYSSLKAERDELLRQLEDSCPLGWIKFNSSCYYISNDRMTWNESRQYCRERGADLVIIDTEEEQIFISMFHNFWIGLTDSNEEGTWKWVNGTTLTTGFLQELCVNLW
ncbi:hypothetical protein JZ751_022366, partial [Albula glossodonta]